METKRYLPRLKLALMRKLLLMAKSVDLNTKISPQELISNVYVGDIAGYLIGLGYDDKLIKFKTIWYTSVYLDGPGLNWATDEQKAKINSGEGLPCKNMADNLFSQFVFAWDFSHKEHQELPPFLFTADIYDDKIQQSLSVYIEDFIAGNLMPDKDSTPFTYFVQRKRAIKSIQDMNLVLGTANIVLRDWDLGDVSEHNQNKITFLETILGLEHEGYLSIVDVIDLETVCISLTKEAKQSIPTRLEWESISLNSNGLGVINTVEHRYVMHGDHYKLLKRLIEQRLQSENSPEVTKEELCLIIDEKPNKAGWEIVKQKIRDMRRYHEINRKINNWVDVFKDTSHGYMLIAPQKFSTLKQK